MRTGPHLRRQNGIFTGLPGSVPLSRIGRKIFWPQGLGIPITGTGPDTKAYEQDLNGNARIGARIKVSDNLKARFEYGAKDGNANLRILWGEWNFGPGSLGVGQHYTPLAFPYSNQVYNIYEMKDGDINMSIFGLLYGDRQAMIRLKFGTFQIAAVEPRELVYAYYTFDGTDASAMASQPNTETKLPNIQAKYRLDFDWGHLNLAGGLQSFEVVDSGQSFDVDSYVLALGRGSTQVKPILKVMSGGDRMSVTWRIS